MVIPRKNVKNEKDEWKTPDWLFDLLNEEFHFKCDAAATKENTKLKLYMNNALVRTWAAEGGPYFMNPPYSGHQINKFMEKALKESLNGAIVVCLVPVSSDTQWWHRNVMEAQEIRFIEGRVDYVGYDSEGNLIKQAPTFPSCVVIFDLSHENRERDYDRPYIGKTIKNPRKN